MRKKKLSAVYADNVAGLGLAVRSRSRSSASAVSQRSSGAAEFWALLGVAIVALALSNWLRWAASADFAQPDPGPDPYAYIWVLRLTEFLSSAVFLLLLWITLLGPLLRQRRISLDGKLFLGGFFASTLDVLYGAYNPTWAMNAHALSMGTWAGVFPGFPSPAMEHNAWGLLWCLPAYIWLGVGAAIVGCGVLNRLRAAFPTLGTAALYTLLQLLFMVAFAGIATFWNRTEVYTYVSAPRGLTLWYGQTYQLPLYEPLCIAAYCMGYTWLRDTADADGRCAVDRNLDRSRYGAAVRSLMSTLAVCGYAAFVTLAAYQIPYGWFAMRGDSHPALPSYLQPGLWCGQPGKPLCAGQYLKQQRDLYYAATAKP